MKKMAISIMLLFVFNNSFEQLAAGKYQIKLAFSQKAIELYSNSFVLNPSCENPLAAACKKQVWDVKNVAGRAGVYTITNSENNQLLTHFTENEGRGFSMYLRLLPIKPQAQREDQYFNIIEKRNADRSVAGYIIQPYSRSNPTMAQEYYFGARESSMRWDNCPLEMFFNNGADTEKMSYEHLLFSLQRVSGGVIVRPSVINNNSNAPVLVAPNVVVAPKSDNKIDIDLKTGNDNLEVKDFQKNPEIRIIVQGHPDVINTNINNGQNWPKNAIRRISLSLPNNISIADIKEIQIHRTQLGSADNFKAIAADNWDLQSISATATLLANGTKTKTEFEKIISNRRGSPLFRFVYERGDNVFTGTVLKQTLTLKNANSPTIPAETAATANAVLNIVIGTGGDDLRGGNDNCNVVLTFKSNPRKFQLTNVFNRRSLGGFTEKTVTKEIPNSQTIDINDIKSVEIHHTGGGGMGADNWDIDKVKITIDKDGQTKILVDKVGAPIHRFDGDFRIKRFNVE